MAGVQHRAPVSHSGPDVCTREGAIAWSGRRLRKIGLVFLVAVLAAPVASFAVVAWRSAKKLRLDFLDLPLLDLVLASLQWAGVAVACMGVVVAIIGAKYVRFSRMARPVIERGMQREARVVGVTTSTRRGGGVNHNKLTVTVAASDGSRAVASIEEMDGTDLPTVEIDAPATAWTLGGRVVIGTSGALFVGE